MKAFALCVLLLAGTAASAAAAEKPFAGERIAWMKPFKPFRVMDNLYYVGVAGVSAFLIVTPKGAILTDGALPESASAIEKNIQTLGFKLRDVKILLNSHAHFDHSGGLAKLKADTGAKFYASAQDKPYLESGHIDFGPASQIDTAPVRVDQVVKDGDTVSLGDVTLTANITPGHSKGCTTWTTTLKDKGVSRKVMFFCSLTVAGNPLTGTAAYPNITDDYKKSFARLDRMQTDVFLAPHGDQFGLDAKLAKLKPGQPNPFVDPGELHRRIAQLKTAYDAELARQFAAKGPPKDP